ncbi:hypothetical protein DLAC_03990 [Tieghemostelium lacteum]|uniref:Uncharacterized protein n=1 Tax=Tieghemostelium lacteum TaxID=361077 RepID=A0A151ZRU0_TIELA|nr:hypothetical protein DLAC_03990 [Tieghemostelium lacteum]|eukprot:KYQ96697.1 hypothetical protein DLAC_03990 [Tieghemostelium lacteum]
MDSNETYLNLLRSNVIILKSFSESIKLSFGPYGLSKIIVDQSENENKDSDSTKQKRIIISSDGFTLLKFFKIKHPIGDFIKRYLLNREYLIHGGVSSVLILSTHLLESSLDLLLSGLDLDQIYQGFKYCLKQSLLFLDSLKNNNNNSNISNNSYIQIKSKFNLIGKNELLELLNSNPSLNLSKVHSQVVVNLNFRKEVQIILIENSLVFRINKYINIPTYKKHSISENNKSEKVLLFGIDIQLEKSNLQIQLEFNNIKEMLDWKVDEEHHFKKYLKELVEVHKVTTIVTSGDIDDIALHYMNQFNILALRYIPITILTKLSVALGSKINYSMDIKDIELGNQYQPISINEYQITPNNHLHDDNDILYQFKISLSPLNTILISGTNEFQSQELKKYLDDIIMYSTSTLDNNNNNNYIKVKEPIELELSNHLLNIHLPDKESIVKHSIEKYAKSLLLLGKTNQHINNNNIEFNENLQLKRKIYSDSCNLIFILLQINDLIVI